MKTGSILLGLLTVLIFAGCGARPYADVKSKDYATLQLVPHSSTLIMSDDFYANVFDETDGCKKEVSLGQILTDSDTPSRVVKLPVDKYLYINVFYDVRQLDNSVSDRYWIEFMLKPQKGKHYVIAYVKKDVSLLDSVNDFDVYMVENGKKVDVPSSRAWKFNRKVDCKPRASK